MHFANKDELILNFLRSEPLLNHDFILKNQHLKQSVEFPSEAQREAIINRFERYTQYSYPLSPESSPNRRLGRFFESIVRAALHSLYPFDEVYSNIKVPRPYAPGELDFLIKTSRETIHLEVAVKFFLFLPCESVTLADFVGPRKNDRLDLKIAKIFDKQLQRHIPDAYRHAGEKTSDVQRALWLMGMLFYPWQLFLSRSFPVLNQLNPSHQKGWWMTQTEALSHLQDSQFLSIPKPYWLASIKSPKSLEGLATISFGADTLLDEPVFALDLMQAVNTATEGS